MSELLLILGVVFVLGLVLAIYITRRAGPPPAYHGDAAWNDALGQSVARTGAAPPKQDENIY